MRNDFLPPSVVPNVERDIMKLSDYNQKTLMLAIHQKIEEYADFIVEKLNNGETSDIINYPPNGGLNDDEKKALDKLKNDETLKSALKKVLADNSAGVIFELMNYLDGTTDPDSELGDWTEVSFVDKTESIESPEEMLHDSFYETYLDWKEIRLSSG
jgi:hypothetical protein